MAIKGCLFDFSGTLFRVESAESWLRGGLAEAGITASEAEIARYALRLDEAGALPGGRSPDPVPPELERLWRERDLDPARHRAVYTALARRAGLPWPRSLLDILYERHRTPVAWTPYPDAAEVLTGLRERGVPVAVLSNIGWDLRPVLREYGVAHLVDATVLSYEQGVQKPDPRIFRMACQALGVAPAQVLMVGDDGRADAAATAVGCAFHRVEHLPVAARPDGLRPVLAMIG